MKPKARQHFIEAHRCAPDISWLAKFARKQNLIESTANSEAQTAVLTQVERLAANLARLGNTHDMKYVKLEAAIMGGVRNHETFENAQKELGGLLDFVAHKVEREGSPDPWWISVINASFSKTTSIPPTEGSYRLRRHGKQHRTQTG